MTNAQLIECNGNRFVFVDESVVAFADGMLHLLLGIHSASYLCALEHELLIVRIYNTMYRYRFDYFCLC